MSSIQSPAIRPLSPSFWADHREPLECLVWQDAGWRSTGIHGVADLHSAMSAVTGHFLNSPAAVTLLGIRLRAHEIEYRSFQKSDSDMRWITVEIGPEGAGCAFTLATYKIVLPGGDGQSA